MTKVSWINDLKLRGSWGRLGSQVNVNPDNAFSTFGGGLGDSYYDLAKLYHGLLINGNDINNKHYKVRIDNNSATVSHYIRYNLSFLIDELNTVYRLLSRLEFSLIELNISVKRFVWSIIQD